jgi:hypothetical protein
MILEWIQHMLSNNKDLPMENNKKPNLTIVPSTNTTSPKMRKWPDDPSRLISYSNLIDPLKEVLIKGYRLFRKDDVKSFDYTGFNIGKQEQTIYPSPKNRLKEKSLQEAKKSGKTLMDVILNITFLLGIEQGRRAERREHKSIEELCETLEVYRNSNKDLRIKIDELEVYIESKKIYPNASDEDLNYIIEDGIKARRAIRMEEYQKELLLDCNKNTFKFKTPHRINFKELCDLAQSINNCSKEQWEELLAQRGWTLEEWQARCKKKNIKSNF